MYNIFKHFSSLFLFYFHNVSVNFSLINVCGFVSYYLANDSNNNNNVISIFQMF